MRFPLLQAKVGEEYKAWPTGEHRDLGEFESPDVRQPVMSNDELTKEIWEEEMQFGVDFLKEKYQYERGHWFGWEHCEDPRFDSAEPNRGRTSSPVNSILLDSVSSVRYDLNKRNYTINTNPAEWFSPENIKMLPLIKL